MTCSENYYFFQVATHSFSYTDPIPHPPLHSNSNKNLYGPCLLHRISDRVKAAALVHLQHGGLLQVNDDVSLDDVPIPSILWKRNISVL